MAIRWKLPNACRTLRGIRGIQRTPLVPTAKWGKPAAGQARVKVAAAGPPTNPASGVAFVLGRTFFHTRGSSLVTLPVESCTMRPSVHSSGGAAPPPPLGASSPPSQPASCPPATSPLAGGASGAQPRPPPPRPRLRGSQSSAGGACYKYCSAQPHHHHPHHHHAAACLPDRHWHATRSNPAAKPLGVPLPGVQMRRPVAVTCHPTAPACPPPPQPLPAIWLGGWVDGRVGEAWPAAPPSLLMPPPWPCGT